MRYHNSSAKNTFRLLASFVLIIMVLLGLINYAEAGDLSISLFSVDPAIASVGLAIGLFGIVSFALCRFKIFTSGSAILFAVYWLVRAIALLTSGVEYKTLPIVLALILSLAVIALAAISLADYQDC